MFLLLFRCVFAFLFGAVLFGSLPFMSPAGVSVFAVVACAVVGGFAGLSLACS